MQPGPGQRAQQASTHKAQPSSLCLSCVNSLPLEGHRDHGGGEGETGRPWRGREPLGSKALSLGAGAGWAPAVIFLETVAGASLPGRGHRRRLRGVPAGPRRCRPQALAPPDDAPAPVSGACEGLMPPPPKASPRSTPLRVWTRRTAGQRPGPRTRRRCVARLRGPLCSSGCRSEFTIFDFSLARLTIPAPGCFHNGMARSWRGWSGVGRRGIPGPARGWGPPPRVPAAPGTQHN